jgi:hypothetical protein
VTLASRIGAPPGSVTVPTIRPVASCAHEAAAKRVIKAKLTSKLRFAEENQLMKSNPFAH